MNEIAGSRMHLLAHIEALVERYEAQHAMRWLYLTSTVKDPVELYQRRQNSLRTFRHELASVARQFQFDPTTGQFEGAS